MLEVREKLPQGLIKKVALGGAIGGVLGMLQLVPGIIP
jgi:hypothetical protein